MHPIIHRRSLMSKDLQRLNYSEKIGQYIENMQKMTLHKHIDFQSFKCCEIGVRYEIVKFRC